MNMREYQEMRSKAARIKNWYLVNGQWHHLTRAEARQIVLSGKASAGFRPATVDEELEKDGI